MEKSFFQKKKTTWPSTDILPQDDDGADWLYSILGQL
jgi:hypothetical protein